MAADAAERGGGRQPLLPPAVREGLLREAKQQAAAARAEHLLPLAVRAVASAESELRARVRAVQAAAVTKSAVEAADARAAGEQRLQSGDAKGSLAHFTWALQKAPHQSPDAAAALALLYTARSAALLAVGESRAALSDATEALLLAPLYPQAWRRYAAAHPHPSDTVRNMALRLCNDDGDDKDASSLSLAAEGEALQVVAQLRDTSAAEEDGASASDPTESTALVKEGRAGVDGPGRCLVTTSAVSGTGKLLLTDQPLALAVRRAGGWQQRCHWCTAVATAPIPCSGCADAIYCSRSCRAAAWSTEHRDECGCVVPLLLPAETTLACRLQRRCSHDADAASTVRALQSHEMELTVDRCVDQCLQAATAAFLLKTIQVYDQSETKVSVDVGVEEEAKELLGYLCRIDTNAHAITAVVPLQPEAANSTPDDGRSLVPGSSSTGASIEHVTQERVAVALYPCASLVNHACAPSARVQFSGRQLQLVSATAMRPAAEVTISYGPTAGRTAVAVRREQLQEQYHFLCCCSACEDEKPFDTDDTSIPAAALDAALGLLDEGRVQEAIATLGQCCTHQMSLLEAHDAAGDERRATTTAQQAAETFDALGRAYCQKLPEPDYCAAADAIEQALSLLRRSAAAAPGAEPSLAREEHKLATLRFHAAVQAGPTSRGQAAVAAAAKAARRALIYVREALGVDDPIVGELEQMVAALGDVGEQEEEQKQEQEQEKKKNIHEKSNAKKNKNGKDKTEPKTEPIVPAADLSGSDVPGADKTKKSTNSTKATSEKKKDEQADLQKIHQGEAAGTGDETSNDRLVLVVVRCVEVLRDSSAVDERLAMATQLYSLLSPADADTKDAAQHGSPAEMQRLQRAFLAAGGAEVLHARLASMDEGWLAEAKNGAMDLYDKLARLDFVRDEFVKVAAEDEKILQKAIHENECVCIECKLPPGVEQRPRKPKSKASKNKQQTMKAAASSRRRPSTSSAAVGVDLSTLGGFELGELEGASETELDNAAIALSKEVGRAAKSMQAAQEPSTKWSGDST